jgi:hypothetical protein
MLMGNRYALSFDCKIPQAVVTGERVVAKAMAADIPGAHQSSRAADKNYAI